MANIKKDFNKTSFKDAGQENTLTWQEELSMEIVCLFSLLDIDLVSISTLILLPLTSNLFNSQTVVSASSAEENEMKLKKNAWNHKMACNLRQNK